MRAASYSTSTMYDDMIYLLTAIGFPPGGSSTVHIYTQTIHRTKQNKQYREPHKNFGRVRAVPRLFGLYPGICLTTEEKARKTLSQGSRRVAAGTMKIHVTVYVLNSLIMSRKSRRTADPVAPDLCP